MAFYSAIPENPNNYCIYSNNVEIVERRFPLGACGRIVFLVVEFAVDGVAFLAAFVDRLEPFGLTKFVRMVFVAESLVRFHGSEKKK